jgi:hypothetical protein
MKTHKGKLLEEQDLGLWKGDIVTFLPAEPNPVIRWTGAKIPYSVLEECLAFFRYGEDKWNSEVQVRMFYNPEGEGTWKAQAFPQWTSTGMTTKEIDTSSKTYDVTDEHRELRAKIMVELDEAGFLPNGTNHSHCSSGAFQSSVDHADEVNQPGVHLTMGCVTSDNVEIHGRVSFRGVLYEIVYQDWVQMENQEPLTPIKLLNWHVPYEKDKEKLKEAFPKQWLDCCFEKVYAPVKTGFHPYGAYQVGYNAYTAHQDWAGYGDDTDDEWDYTARKWVHKEKQEDNTKPSAPFNSSLTLESIKEWMGKQYPCLPESLAEYSLAFALKTEEMYVNSIYYDSDSNVTNAALDELAMVLDSIQDAIRSFGEELSQIVSKDNLIAFHELPGDIPCENMFDETSVQADIIDQLVQLVPKD